MYSFTTNEMKKLVADSILELADRSAWQMISARLISHTFYVASSLEENMTVRLVSGVLEPQD